MHDAPSPAQIIAAVQAYLQDEAVPALDDGHGDDQHEHAAYHGRVAANLLAIAARQLAEDPALAQAETARLRALLGPVAGDGHDLAALTQTLATAIADGHIGPQTPGLVDHLWATTLAKLAVDQPRYETYRRHAGEGG